MRVVINLAPGDLRKEGPAFDLPIAVELLVVSGQLDRPRLQSIWCVGELGLDGSLSPCRGVMTIANLAARHGAQALVARTAPQELCGGPAGGRKQPKTRGTEPRPQRGAVPRRAGGVPTGRA